MSAAAGLSAARRRRAGGNTGGNTSSDSNTSNQTASVSQSSSRQNPGFNPMQILNNHEIKIGQIIKKIDMMDKGSHELKDQLDNYTEESAHNINSSDDVLSELLQRISMLEKKYQKDNNMEDISFFRNKTKLLEEQIADVKRLLLKVQTFAMETNLSVMKVNKNTKTIEKDSNQTINFTELNNADLTS